MAEILLPIALAFLMFIVGLRLGFGDFRAIARSPAALAAGLAAQVLLLPAIALGLAYVFGLTPAMRLGLIVVAAAPGGITSNFIAVLARADVALSTAMTLVTSLLAVVSIPLILSAFVENGTGGGLPLLMLKTALPVFAVSAVPLLLGIAIRGWRPAIASRIEPPLRRIGTVVFAALVVSVFYQNWPAVTAHADDVGPAVVILNLGIIAVALAGGPLLRLPQRQTLAIAIECGLQNVAMAMFVAMTILGRPEIMVPAMIYAITMNVSVLVLVYVGQRTIAEPAQIRAGD